MKQDCWKKQNRRSRLKANLSPVAFLAGTLIAFADLNSAQSVFAAELIEHISEPAAASLLESPSSEPAAVFANEVLKLELHLSERRLAVYRGEMLIANYSVAVGREGWQTPTGEFSVFQKQSDPAWEHPFTGEVIPPGPDNPLGTRWIGFWSDGQNSIGFHGTPDESVIGSAVSHGCVRMRNEDVLALYEQVSVDTPVVVLP